MDQGAQAAWYQGRLASLDQGRCGPDHDLVRVPDAGRAGGGRLPTATELRLDGISFHDDQWTPIIPSAIDTQTGRNDGQRSTVENAWANIGPRKYQIEFPSWGLNTNPEAWRSLTYFYVRKHCRVLIDSEGMTPIYTNWNLEYKQPNNYHQEELFTIMHADGECPRSHQIELPLSMSLARRHRCQGVRRHVV